MSERGETRVVVRVWFWRERVVVVFAWGFSWGGLCVVFFCRCGNTTQEQRIYMFIYTEASTHSSTLLRVLRTAHGTARVVVFSHCPLTILGAEARVQEQGVACAVELVNEMDQFKAEGAEVCERLGHGVAAAA